MKPEITIEEVLKKFEQISLRLDQLESEKLNWFLVYGPIIISILALLIPYIQNKRRDKKTEFIHLRSRIDDSIGNLREKEYELNLKKTNNEISKAQFDFLLNEFLDDMFLKLNEACQSYFENKLKKTEFEQAYKDVIAIRVKEYNYLFTGMTIYPFVKRFYDQFNKRI